jgi:hypothetical protein
VFLRFREKERERGLDLLRVVAEEINNIEREKLKQDGRG